MGNSRGLPPKTRVVVRPVSYTHLPTRKLWKTFWPPPGRRSQRPSRKQTSVSKPSNKEKSPYYGALQDVVDALFVSDKTVRRLDAVLMAESVDLPDDLREIVELLPPGTYTRQRLCDQINSSITGHAWGQVYGTVE